MRKEARGDRRKLSLHQAIITSRLSTPIRSWIKLTDPRQNADTLPHSTTANLPSSEPASVFTCYVRKPSSRTCSSRNRRSARKLRFWAVIANQYGICLDSGGRDVRGSIFGGSRKGESERRRKSYVIDSYVLPDAEYCCPSSLPLNRRY
jgi:hypothetical protein